MELRPVISALGRNKVGALLIALQMAVTLAILCNALYIVQQRLVLIARPSGVDEANVFTLQNQWLGEPADEQGLLQADLAALRAIPGVTDVFQSNAVPLNDSAMTLGITLHPDNMQSLLIAATYLGDQNALHTLGARLVAGRDFTSSDVRNFNFDALSTPPINGILVTRALADKLAPGGNVLGRVASIYPFSLKAPIIGIIGRLEAPFVNAPDNRVGSFIENSMVLPYRVLNPIAFYIVRVKPGALGATRPAIVRYLQTENFMISAAGVVLGVGLAVGGNVWMVDSFAMHRLPPDYLIVGIAAMLALGQLAVLWPSLRAASVPPAVATRML